MEHTPIPAKIFATILKSVPICTVDVLFFNKDMSEIALFKRNNEPLKNIYFSMGGRLLKDEKIVGCAKRQVQRELGMKIKDSDLTFGGIQEEIHPNSAFKGASYHAVGVFYYCKVDENKFKPKLDNQHQDFRWFSVTDKKIHPFIKTRLKKIFNKDEKGF
jgi:ADP-ribose pyrophosphatase YjhB (NUDIX family)